MKHRRVVEHRAPLAPFLKWVGGKRALLPEIVSRFPDDIAQRHYVEPFVGGGAVFFHRRPLRATIADTNADLVATYCAIRDDVDAVIDVLEWHQVRHDFASIYNSMRDKFNRRAFASEAERAAAFVYLNRTGFNGLFRRSRAGKYNVPEGKYERPRIVDMRGLYEASIALRGVEVRASHFEETCSRLGPDAFVYFDPPYVPVSASSSFTAYDSDGFGHVEQLALRNTFERLDRLGARVMLSNSAAPLVQRLYSSWRVDIVRAPRRVNADASTRGLVDEVIVRNY